VLLWFTTAQKGWKLLLTHIIVEVAKALGGSFKLVTLAPRTVMEMTQLPKETQKKGDTNKSKRTNKHAKHKPRLNLYKKHSAQAGCMNWSW